MLPWIFVVLVLVNAGLFLWGYQREKALEPPHTPVPEGSYEIRLLGEVQEGQLRDARDSNDLGPDSQAASEEDQVARGLPADADVGSSAAQMAETAEESGSGSIDAGPSAAEVEYSDQDGLPGNPAQPAGGHTLRDQVSTQSKPDRATISEVVGEKQLTAGPLRSESDGNDVAGIPSTGLSEQGPGGLSPDELKADGPATRAEGFVAPPPNPSKSE